MASAPWIDHRPGHFSQDKLVHGCHRTRVPYWTGWHYLRVVFPSLFLSDWSSFIFTEVRTTLESETLPSYSFSLSKFFCRQSVQCSSVTQSCLTLCNPMNRSTPGLPVHHRLPEIAQTHVHRVGDAIQLSLPLSPSPPAPNPSQHQSLWPMWMSHLFAWSGQSTGVSALASFLPMTTRDWSPLEWTVWISLQSKGLSESSPTPQFKSINSSLLSFLHSPTLTSIHEHWKNHSLD